MIRNKNFSAGPQQALQKLKQYCAYQERCHQEVKQKLSGYGIYGAKAEEIIAQLIEENYLNESRFASLFAGGKFRMKAWGRKKIIQELKTRGVSNYCIKTAIAAIPEQNYLQTLDRLIEKKLVAIGGSSFALRRKKLWEYLYQKGYEPEIFQERIENLLKGDGVKKKKGSE